MNCKPGDLAIMVNSNVTENIGAIFEIMEFDAEGTERHGVPCWRVRSSRPTRNSDGSMSIGGIAADFHLLPIAGLPVRDEVTDDIKEPS